MKKIGAIPVRLLTLSAACALLSLLNLSACSTSPSDSPRDGMMQSAHVNAELAMNYMQNGNYQDAKAKLLLAQSQSPRDPAVWYTMGFYEEAVGDTPAAKKAYLKAVKLNPQSGLVQNNYGTFLCRNGEYRASIQHFLLATEDLHYMQTGEAYENAGLCALKIPDTALAKQYFLTALKNQPTLMSATLELAELNYREGHMQEAKHYLAVFEGVNRQPRPEVMWLKIRIARKTGDKAGAAEVTRALLNNFPTSPQSRLVQAEGRGAIAAG